MSYHVRFEDLGVRDYKETWDYQESLLDALRSNKLAASASSAGNNGEAMPHLLFVEHPHVYTLGKSGSENNLLINYMQLQAHEASFYHIDRGGDITYHGPGQLVGYPIFDLDLLGIGLRQYIGRLEQAIADTLEEYGLHGAAVEGATGVWLDTGPGLSPRKICAIGVKVSRGVTMHGFAFNINTDLEYFSHINPCGYTDRGVTSLQKELGKTLSVEEVKGVVREKLANRFNLKYSER